MNEVGKRCTDGFRWGTVIEQEGTMIRVRWDFGKPDTEFVASGLRPRETVRVIP